MKYLKLILIGLFVSLTFSPFIHSNNISYLNDVLPNSSRGNFELSVSKAEFNENLDVLGYIDNLSGARPKQADISEVSVSYRFLDKYRLTLQSSTSAVEIIRSGIPSSLETEADTDYISFSFPIFKNKERDLDFELFYTETTQDPLTIDCYGFGSIVLGGSCAEADVKLLDSQIYRNTGDRVYLPVLKTQGSSEGFGINLRIKKIQNETFNISHTLSLGEEEILMKFDSAILNTTDSFLRGVRINGTTTGELLDNFKNDLPQETPWKERYFKYSLNLTYGISAKLALSGRLGLIKVNRTDYQKNPNKKDFTDNQLIDLGFFYQPQKNILLYTRMSLSTRYLLGITPISYNRKSNHLFDHPYGQLYIGTLIRF